MKYLLATVVLAFAPQTPDCNHISGNSFNPPAAPQCIDGTMDWNCVHACDEEYREKMRKAHVTHCLATNAIIAELEAALADCRTEYETCLQTQPQSVCDTNQQACMYDAKMNALNELEIADAILDAKKAAAKAAHAACSSMCCIH